MLPINFSTFPTSPQIIFFRQVRFLSPTSASMSQEAVNSTPRNYSLTDSSECTVLLTHCVQGSVERSKWK